MQGRLLTRRDFVRSLGWGGLSIAGLLNAPALSASESIVDADEQQSLKDAASHVMTFGSPYVTEDWRSTPHMHQQLKSNIQEMSHGQIYVDIQDAGKAGVGVELTASVSHGTIDAALVSVSNLSRVAPELDILNIPFWSADNQSYLNLVTSKIWDQVIVDKIKSQNKIDVLFHYVVGPRTATSVTLSGKTLRTPVDMNGEIFRVPASRTLQLIYEMAGATPREVAWKRTSYAAREGYIDALDPSIIGLYNGPDGLRNHLGVISQIDSVHDGWVAVVNKVWLDALPRHLRLIVRDAAEKTFQQHLLRTREVTQHCIGELARLGTTFYVPTEQEREAWIDCCGPTKKQWDPIKKRLLGDTKTFERLIEATQINNGYDFL
ncbi:MAG: TRAP transporter substrate-binding protein DctP [Motiliproteus sp.]